MLAGILTAIVAGCLFATGAGLFAHVARRGIPFLLFLSMGATVAFLISLAFAVNWSQVSTQTRVPELAMWIVIAAIANTAGHRSMVEALACGHAPVAWAIGQGGQTMPFVASVLIWQEKTSFVSWWGMVILLGGVIALAFARSRRQTQMDSGNRRYVLYALLAMLCYGVNQTLMCVPSHWVGYQDVGTLRVPLTFATVAMMGFILSSRPDITLIRRILPLVLVYGLVSYGCFHSIYLSLDMLSGVHHAGLAWPIACGTGVVMYAVWEQIGMKRKTSARDWLAILLVVSGIAMLTVR